MEPRSGFRITGQLVLGVSIAVVGVLFTLDNLHILSARDYLQYWPLALIAIGLVHAGQSRTAAGVAGGAIWIVVGSALLGDRLGFVHVNIWNYWPLLLVPDVSGPYGMPRNTLMPVFAMPRTTPFVVSTSKNSGPLARAFVTAAAPRGDCVVDVCASASCTPPAPAATMPASPALITLRRDRLTVCAPVRSFAAMCVSYRDGDELSADACRVVEAVTLYLKVLPGQQSIPVG
jgi:hypothetical protein